MTILRIMILLILYEAYQWQLVNSSSRAGKTPLSTKTVADTQLRSGKTTVCCDILVNVNCLYGDDPTL